MAIYLKTSDLDCIPDSVSDCRKAEFLSCVWETFPSVIRNISMLQRSGLSVNNVIRKW